MTGVSPALKTVQQILAGGKDGVSSQEVLSRGGHRSREIRKGNGTSFPPRMHNWGGSLRVFILVLTLPPPRPGTSCKDG